jgi:hypothetical protein
LSSLPLSELCLIHVGTISWPAEYGTSTAALALGLVGVFPHLENIGYDNHDWEDINEMIKFFRRQGRFVFGSGLLQGAH